MRALRQQAFVEPALSTASYHTVWGASKLG
jgi:hypothetical protein